MEYYIDQNCSDKNDLQVFLNDICGYQNNVSLKIQHRGRLNLFYWLIKGLIRERKINDFDSALDIGCGGGIYSQIISSFGFKKVTGIDLATSGIDIARQYFEVKTGQKIINFQVSNAESFDSADKFNFILCTEVIEHTSDPGKVIENIKSLLSTNGIAVITLPNRLSWPYFVEYLAYKIKRKKFNQDLIDHLNYPFYKSINLFKDEKIRIIKTSGSNFLLDSLSMKLLHRTPFFGPINRLNFAISRISPFKYFSQFFYIIIQKIP